MKIIETKKALNDALGQHKNTHTGFVPTMGALHSGHLSLVERCRKENDIIVVSVFVNPTQFNDKKDLDNYPRTLSEDVEKLEVAGCDYLFVPSVEEMYPQEDMRVFDFGMLDKVMEGAFRTGHFNGVAQIVSKLFEAVHPNRAYFGEKDFQQLAIIRNMVAQLGCPVEVIGCPIVREADGLAMSSRNVRLTAAQRQSAPLISRILFESRKMITTMPIAQLKQWVIDQINLDPELQTEYFEIVDNNTLLTTDEYKEHSLRGCIAVFAGSVRLIDNIAY